MSVFCSPRGKYQYGAGDNAKLLRLIEDQVMASGQQMDFERIWEVFRAGDRNQRGTISREQVGRLIGSPHKKTLCVDPMLVQCWADVVDGGPTLNQHWVNASCLRTCI